VESSRLCFWTIKSRAWKVPTQGKVPGYATLKLKPDWKFPDKPGNSRRFAWIFSILDAKFQSMLCDKYPGRFPLMQIVVLRHALPGPEFSGIIFAVYEPMRVENTGGNAKRLLNSVKHYDNVFTV
jgi:hypothetical protein